MATSPDEAKEREELTRKLKDINTQVNDWNSKATKSPEGRGFADKIAISLVQLYKSASDKDHTSAIYDGNADDIFRLHYRVMQAYSNMISASVDKTESEPLIAWMEKSLSLCQPLYNYLDHLENENNRAKAASTPTSLSTPESEPKPASAPSVQTTNDDKKDTSSETSSYDHFQMIKDLIEAAKDYYTDDNNIPSEAEHKAMQSFLKNESGTLLDPNNYKPDNSVILEKSEAEITRISQVATSDFTETFVILRRVLEEINALSKLNLESGNGNKLNASSALSDSLAEQSSTFLRSNKEPAPGKPMIGTILPTSMNPEVHKQREAENNATASEEKYQSPRLGT